MLKALWYCITKQSDSKMQGFDMGWEWNCPAYWRDEGYHTVFSFDIRAATKGDHSPNIFVNLVVLNYNLLDVGYYNGYHEEGHG